MMRISLFVLVLMITCLSGFAQTDKIDPELLQRLESGVREPQKIMVSFDEEMDFDLLKQSFSANQLPVRQRAGYVMNALKKVAEQSQKDLIQMCISQYDRQIFSFRPFWIVNKVFIECQPSVIYAIAALPEVSYINIETDNIRFEQPVVGGSTQSVRSPGSAEPGLYAINAQRMWELGYTGRGRLVYNYDTGVWPDHPAFKDRYLGNRFSENQSWIGYSSPVPNGEINSHGTHVLGTIAGLVPETNDTLGVAMNAYWIANDFVGTRVEGLPPIEAMISAFEWALNPDGDMNTNYDVPDVINNSWRWYDAADQVHCGQGLIVDLMNAIEAAGIANVFAGGNFGPDNTTISSPQRINTSKVNTFSVGSINANLSYPYPISDYSSRGPTQCAGSDFDRIHPQVVAPGEMVRSAWGSDGYNTISGTSMAAPHVSGALLLLKEAFPYLPGDELLWALYRSATDFGEAGEDNVFGNGLIDVFAAFQLLSETWQPVDPRKPDWDLSVEGITGVENNGITCNNAIYPVIHCTNKGINAIDSLLICYWFTRETDTIKMLITNEILPSENLAIELGEILLEGKDFYELNVDVRIPGITEEYDVFNNRLKSSVRKFDPIVLPFMENFEQGIIDNYWWQYNPDHLTTWETIAISGHENNQYAASMQFFNYAPRAGQIDQLVLHNVEIPDTVDTYLSFDLAYAPFLKNTPQNRDTLRIKVFANCVASESEILFEKAGESLITHDVIALNFQPQHSGQWRKEILPLNKFAGSVISLAFESVNLKWNNLYIDNIQIDSIPALSTKQLSANAAFQMRVFPNPAFESVKIELDPLPESEYSVSLWNAQGLMIERRTGRFSEGVNWNISHLPPGFYLIRIDDEYKYAKTAGFVKIPY